MDELWTRVNARFQTLLPEVYSVCDQQNRREQVTGLFPFAVERRGSTRKGGGGRGGGKGGRGSLCPGCVSVWCVCVRVRMCVRVCVCLSVCLSVWGVCACMCVGASQTWLMLQFLLCFCVRLWLARQLAAGGGAQSKQKGSQQYHAFNQTVERQVQAVLDVRCWS
jgi:hypothetical protein